MSRWRTLTLIAVHVLIVIHVIHWQITGHTLSPVEPSEAMYTLNEGHLNAGFIFFAVALLATLLLGRFVCGWGCHFIAYQDLCRYLLGRVGIRPKPLRSRLLMLAPLALAIYMFVWPTVYRWVTGIPAPQVTNHLVTGEFWKTFPGAVITILTIALAGFAIVYFLGSKGFCTYACPYGGFFALTDQVAPGRIVVNDSCEHSGHCTAACSSNVRVHEEVAKFGMVVDPGCMKCMDCVSVCPNDALHFGFARPSLGAKPKAPTRPVRYDFTLAEEGLMAVIGLGALLAFRGLYDQIPLLLSMGLAAITAYLSLKLWRTVRSSNVRLQNVQLKRGGRVTRGGLAVLAAVVAWLAFTFHSGFVQYERWRGERLAASLTIGDEVWFPGSSWWHDASAERRARLEQALAHLTRADRWGLVATDTVLTDLLWLHLAADRVHAAEQTARRLVQHSPDAAAPHRGLAGVLRRAGLTNEAESHYRRALAIDPASSETRADLGGLLREADRLDDATALYRNAIDMAVEDGDVARQVRWSLDLARLLLEQARSTEAQKVLERAATASPQSVGVAVLHGVALLQSGRFAEGTGELERAIELDPASADAHYNLGMALLESRRIGEALVHLQKAARLRPDFAAAQYNLGVATFMDGRPADAVPHIERALRLAPDDRDARAFRAFLATQIDGRSAVPAPQGQEAPPDRP